MVTQCPNCTTRFKVSNSQLQVAAGKVRCGACLSVFDGTSTLLLDGEPFTHPEARLDDDTHDLDQLLDELSQVDESAIASEEEAAALATTQENLEVQAPAENQLMDMQGSEELAELEAQLMQELQGEAPAALQANTTDENISEATAEEAEVQPVEHLETGMDGTGTDSTGMTDDGLVAGEPVAEEIRSAEEQENADTTSAHNIAADDDGWVQSSAQSETTDEREEETIEILSVDHAVEDAPAGVPISPELEEPVKSPIVADAIKQGEQPDDADEVLFGDSHAQRRKPLGTFVLILVALVALGAQILYFQFDVWSKDQQFRPIYQTICDVAGCELPVMKDISQIVSRRSITRAHPDNPGVRVVDVLMVNNAGFSQPFPLIELTFNNLDGKMVAGRRFKPQDYLSGDMSSNDLMAPRTPIHVSLHLQDPGPDAQSFRVVFR